MTSLGETKCQDDFFPSKKKKIRIAAFVPCLSELRECRGDKATESEPGVILRAFSITPKKKIDF